MKILFCSDGSDQAERAIRFGATIAAPCQAEVTLLGIAEAQGDSAPLMESLRRGQALLADKKIRAELITKAGDPVEEIRKRTEEATYDLVVVGAVRKAVRGAFWMSSKTYKIIKEIRPPVLSVAGKSGTLKRALICSGGKGFIEPAVRLTGEIARCTSASVTVLHVMADPPAIYAHLPGVEETASRLLASPSELGQTLRQAKETLEHAGVQTEVRLRHGSVLGEILREMHEGDYDLIVTGSGLSRGLRTYVLGDISREIVNRVNCSVLVARTEPAPASGFQFWWGRLAR